MLNDRPPELAGHTFQPSWGPTMAMVWIVVLYASTMIIAFVLGDRGFIAINLPDGSTNLTAIERVAVPLQIVGVLIVASRLRLNPLDVLALRPPAKLGRLIRIALALMAAVFVISVAVVVVEEFLVPDDDIPTDKNQVMVEKFVLRDGLLLSFLMTGFLAPIEEEMTFRGLLLLSFFKTRLWFWGAAFLTSLLFALIHNPGSLNILIHAPYFLMGLAFAWALRLTGSLWVPIFMHVLKNSIAVIVLSAS
jgi:membrane protease YdiL (CAAX protease family)